MKFLILLCLVFTSCYKMDKPAEQIRYFRSSISKEFDDDTAILKPVKLYPPKTGITDSSLISFLHHLKMAVIEKDTSFIIGSLDENIYLSFGGSSGINDFREIWDLSNPWSKFWLTMQRILDLPGRFKDSTFISPYVSTDWPNLDNYFHAAIISANVDLVKSPWQDSTVVTKLSYDVVKLIDEKSVPVGDTTISGHENPLGREDWYYVETLDKKYKGYVYWEQIRSPNDYRMVLERKGDSWKIKTLIAGD